MKPRTPQKIVVSGSGKTTFAQKLATQLDIPHVEMDALFWEPNWTEAPTAVFLDRVERALATPSWVVEGNYGIARDSTWRKAEVIIWLDYPFHVIFGRALYRTLRRALTREQLWSGNRESFRKSFFSKDSILIWVWQTYPRRKREYPALLSQPEFSHLQVLRFESPPQAEEYLLQIATARVSPAP